MYWAHWQNILDRKSCDPVNCISQRCGGAWQSREKTSASKSDDIVVINNLPRESPSAHNSFLLCHQSRRKRNVTIWSGRRNSPPHEFALYNPKTTIISTWSQLRMKVLSDVFAEFNAFILRHLPLTVTILVAFAVSAAVRYIRSPWRHLPP